MNDAERPAIFVGQLVRVVQPCQDLGHRAQVNRERDVAHFSRALANARKRLPVQELHDEYAEIEVGVDVVRLDHVVVMQPRGEACLVLEHRAKIVVHRQLGVQLLQDDLAARSIAVGEKREKNAGHTTAPDFGDQAVVIQRRSRPALTASEFESLFMALSSDASLIGQAWTGCSILVTNWKQAVVREASAPCRG